MEKIEIDVELIKLVQLEMRELRILNMELRSQLEATERTIKSLHMHMPSSTAVEYQPTSIALLNKVLDMAKNSKAESTLDR